MINAKLFLYDSTKEDYKGTDFSQYIELGGSYTDLINEELDTLDLTLAGLGARYAHEFEPTTAFIFELYQGEELYRSFDLVVGYDVVSKPILSVDNYYNHAITFYEAGAIAQKRPVDNISVTYKLKDVTLKTEKANLNLEQPMEQHINGIVYSSSVVFGGDLNDGTGKPSMTKRFCYNGKQYLWEITNEIKQEWKDFYYYVPLDKNEVKTFSISVPKLEIRNGVYGSNTFAKMGYCSVDAIIQDTDIKSGKVTSTTKVIHPTSTELGEWKNDWAFGWESGKSTAPTSPELRGFIVNRVVFKSGWTGFPDYTSYVKRVAMAGLGADTVRKISVDVKEGHKYRIIFQLHNFQNETSPFPLISNYDSASASYLYGGVIKGFLQYSVDNIQTLYTNTGTLQVSLEMLGYLSTRPETIFHSAPPVSAYELFQKCQMATQRVEKEQGKSIDTKEMTFYLNPDDEMELKNTSIVENFYNQKNLWEMFIEIGKYIHSIPYVKFGKDNRFIVSWRKLGISEFSNKEAQPISIFNSKKIDNYISAVTSYVDNAVQLGGIIDEWIVPKSQSEDLLVYNDVAKLLTSKPIIEIVDMEVKNSSGVVKNLAGNDPTYPNGFIFAKEIYNLLGINKDEPLNKGFAIYYTLGTNVIEGLNYRLPALSTGDPESDYAIKRILGLLYMPQASESEWRKIKVNDYTFHIKYRTKDSLRSDQSRPDLRKYLLNSKYDAIPLHNQFNNQEDILVDTQKLGNNIYGKLIKTGNTEYTITEWSDSLYDVKKSGELYDLDSNLFYVSKVKNTVFADHVISEVTLTKDYNQLSEIIGIPSEPRFYEISEQSAIKREVVFNDYIYLGTSHNPEHFAQGDKLTDAWDWMLDLLFGQEGKSVFPKYVITTFKNDRDRIYGTVPDNEQFYTDICLPINVYTMQNTLTMEWDMRDNFSAGDRVSDAEVPKATDKSYRTLAAVRYKDVFGRSDLVDYTIMKDLDLNADQIRALPYSPIKTKYVTNFNIAFGYGLPHIEENKVVDNAFELALTNAVDESYGIESVNIHDIFEVYTYEGEGDYIKRYYQAEYKGKVDNVHKWDILVLDQEPISFAWENKLMSSRDIVNMDNEHGLALMLDNREVFGGNYNLQMLTDSDRFVVSAYLWKPKSYVKFALLSEEINKISNDTIPTTTIIETVDIYNGEIIDKTLINVLKEHFSNHAYGIEIFVGNLLDKANTKDLSRVKAIALIDTAFINGTVASGNTYFICGRNLDGLSNEDKRQNLYISDISQDFFKKQ